MNKDFYRLRSDPFAERADPDFLVMTRPARRALSALLDAVAARRRVSALLGAPGLGKTTLLWALADALGERGHAVALAAAPADLAELTEALVLAVGDESAFPAALAAARGPVLLIDDAHLLDETTRDSLQHRLDGSWHGLAVVVAGSAARLKPDLVERLTPLARDEAVGYLRRRLDAAVLDDTAPFADEALALIAEAAGGVPRALNELAAHLLDTGRREALPHIDGAAARRILGPAAATIDDQPPLPEPVVAVSKTAPDSAAPRKPSLGPVVAALLVMVLALAAGGWALHRWWATQATATVAAPAAAAVEEEVVAELSVAPPARPQPPSREPIARAPQWDALIPPLALPPGGEAGAPPAAVAEPPPPVPPAERSARRRKVQAGDTLFKLMMEVYGRADAALLERLRRTNPQIGDVDRLKVGQTIEFPPE